VPSFLDKRPRVGWIEIHSETWLAPGGPRRRALELIRRDYPVSCHGVGLSLGSAEGLDAEHLARLSAFHDRIEPGLVSDHLAWSVADGVYYNDLLPLPYTEEALEIVCRNIDQAQTALRRPLLVENTSAYLRHADSVLTEAAFLTEMARRSGCFLLLDVNNLFVTEHNGFDTAAATLAALPADLVAEIHVAGHTEQDFEGERLLIDDHAGPVSAPVWDLLAMALRRFGPQPVLVEWDTDVPELDVLLAEAAHADRIAATRMFADAA
jgi:uncharacterized protein (UPF0276 family)